jgi:PIN domain nuclease of toxin-antitoxin system
LSRFLLDSRVFLWWGTENSPLDQRSIEVIRRSPEVYVSAATIWELSIKKAKGKLLESRSLIALAEEFRFKLLPIQPEHAAAILQLEDHHRAPFGHLLLAQAKVEVLTLVTHDRTLARYGVPVLMV